MSASLKWGIIGTGNIAAAFAGALPGSRTGTLVAVGSRSQASADKFGEHFEAPHRHAGYEDLLANDEVEAVYIATPHPMHPEWAIKAAEAGKHILCEKPIALNVEQAMSIVEAARLNGVALMEAFMYRCHPQTARLVELVQAAFGFRAGWNPESRLLNPELGGGGVLDVGCYPVSLARLLAGAAQDAAFADPIEVEAAGHVGDTGVDEYTAALLRFDNGVVAQVATSVRLNQDNVARIYGDDGWIEVPSPWIPGGRDPGAVAFTLHKPGQDPQTITVESDQPLYSLEADALAEAVARGEQQAAPPGMTWDDTLGNMRTLDRWRAKLDLRYPAETPRPVSRTLAGRPLEARPDHNMRYREIPGVDKPVSRMIIGGLAAHGSFNRAQMLLDHWVEVGGTAIDTARIYGKTDDIVGDWLASRGIREKLVLIGKGAHTPNCDPEHLTEELYTTLEKLNTDYLDVYIMHRDNLEIPVDEFVDVMDEHARAGRMTVFGGSNWSLERFEQANAYARDNGKRPMTVLNNNLSLAEMVDPVWAGCIHVSDPDSRAWLEQTHTVHLAWSSQARGFFTDRSGPDQTDDQELVRCWYSEENFARKERARALAAELGVHPINIAAAYVLCQPFPSFALIGPETPTEINTSLPALDVELTGEQLNWLWSGEK